LLFVAILVDFKIYFNRLQGYSTVNNLIFPSLFKKCCCIGQGMKNKNFTVQWLKINQDGLIANEQLIYLF
jgi:hypothetical protein